MAVVLVSMRRNRNTTTTPSDPIAYAATLTQANFELLTKLVPWLDANEKAQRKFRNVMIHKLNLIESIITFVLAGQEAHNQRKQLFYNREKLDEDMKAAEEFVSKQSLERGIRIMEYIYGGNDNSPAPERSRGRRQPWSDWVI